MDTDGDFAWYSVTVALFSGEQVLITYVLFVIACLTFFDNISIHFLVATRTIKFLWSFF